jgi:hypothetical protein
MSIDFQPDPQPSRKAAFACFGFAALLIVLAPFVPSGEARTTVLAFAVFSAVLAIYSLSVAFDRRVILRVGSEGLHYRPFSEKTVPWSEITHIARVKTYSLSVVWGSAAHVYHPQLDQINFAVADPARYPNGPLHKLTRFVQSMDGRPPIAIQTVFIAGASTDGILEAIKRHWPGYIAEIEARPRAPG